MAPALGSDDDLKLLYAMYSLSSGKPRQADIAKAMDLKNTTAGYRVSVIMEKCKEKFGEIGEDGKFSGGGLPDAAPATPAKSKRKRDPKSAGKAASKKAKVEEDAVEGEESDVAARSEKTAAAISYEEAVKAEPEA
ncbi:uncharacterized protein AB675_5071 [Cyphellophora attinorum]|uniref:Uncharacterized protein n=1 Tax=Cyphellophora attinorum TaxID=1664694 RepID=A0A0N1HNQ6_9EURO|nr:uncharacterized protein AB675_5071 [Phialophora attinorum]KPI39214.1 hypothetical protein AB675_5071 [Phialophora attinorum]